MHCLTDLKTNPVKRLAQLAARKMSLDYLHKSLERQMTKFPVCDTNYIANYLGSWKEKEIMPRSVLGVPTLYQFEDTQLYGPEKIDDYLHYLYGDYMKLPPVEQRVFKHDYFCLDLSLPYREYMDTIAKAK